VLVADRSSKLFEPNQATAATVRSLLEPHQGFPLKWSIRLDREGAELSKASLGASPKPVLLAQDADEVKAILGHNPTRGESAILGSGGVVLWHGGAYPGDPGSTARRSLEVSQNQPQQPSRVQTIDTIISSVPASQWRYSAVGVMDAAAAAKRGLPSTQGAILFAGLSDEATSEVTSAALELGLDPDTVIGYRPPETVVPALALPGVGVALSALMFLLCTATTWVSAKDNRSFLQTLLALGIAPRAARRVLGKQFGLMFSVAGIGGFVIAAIPVASVVTFLPGYDLSLPTSNLVVLTGAVVVGCASSVAAASMRLTATGSGL
jgi:hypothetical protein